MRKYLFPLFILCTLYSKGQNPGEWVWLRGDSLGVANFGTQGAPSPLNNPPKVYEPCEWTDFNGNFWMYSGDGTAALWKYDPASNEWSWMKGPNIFNYPGNYGVQGISAPGNCPPSSSIGTISWIDNQGDLWLFGGDGIRNNLWRYNISTNEWTWMKGPGSVGNAGVYGTQGIPDPANNSSSREESAVGWTDNVGDLWLFGGQDASHTGALNDLWRFNISTNTWTWMKGSSISNQPAIYGQMGIPNGANTPGARDVHSHWKDNFGNLWLLGGAYSSMHNDLWYYNPTTNNWTWMRDSILNSHGIYITKCNMSPVNAPRARFENRATWKDQFGNFWMFGGRGDDVFHETMNDLWMYCISANQWIWVSGDSTNGTYGNWGTLGVSSPSNLPAGNSGSIGWTDGNGHLYMFGGLGKGGNSLWEYTIDSSCTNCQTLLSANFVAPNLLCPGTCTDFINLSVSTTSYQWNFPGASPDTSTDINPSNICYANPGSYDVQLIASNANGSDTLLLSNYITVFPFPPPQSITQSGDTLFAIAGSASYQWYYNGNLINGATDFFYVASASGDYNVVATDANGCEVEAAIFNVVAGLTPALSQGEGVMVFPNPVEDKITILMSLPIAIGITRTAVEISVYNVIGEKMKIKISFAAKSNSSFEIDVHTLPAGLYYLEIRSSEKTFRSKFVKQ